ncbi:MAG: MFS transporter [Deltaproteobacteria bacterium]|nr:MFS transporter [Deltaproteobacteria bacterium]MBW2359849.1 MFS transporter [Deltaproteobacteria bacterium]
MTQDPATPVPFHGWQMVSVAFLVDFVAVGFLFYSFGIFYPHIDADFEGATVWVAAGISVSNLVGGILGPTVGRLLDRLPLKRLMLIGACTVSSGFVALSQTQAIWQYYLVLGTFFAIGLSMMGGMASAKLVANWFALKRGRALGIATMGVSLSGIVMPHVATWLIGHFGWRGGFQIYAVGILLIVVPLVWFFVITRPEDVGERPDGHSPDAPAAPLAAADVYWSTRDMLRAPSFWAIALSFGLAMACLSSVLIHLPAYATDLGFDGYQPAWLLSASAFAGMLGKPVFGSLVDRGDPRVAIWTSFGVQFAGVVLLMNAVSYPTLVAGGIVYGFGMGGIVPLQGAVAGRIFGRLSFGKLMGLLRPVQVPLNMIGVPLTAFIHDRTGSFALAFWIFLGVYAAGAALISFLRNPAHDASG